MTEIARLMEPDFTQLADDLKSLHACANELGQATSTNVNAAREALLGGRLVGDDGLAARSLRELQSELQEAARDLESLDQMTTVLEQLQIQTRHMERMARMLRASSSTFAIESARTAECQQAFGSFVEELRLLADKIHDLGGIIGEQSLQIHQQVTRITRSISNDLAELRKLVQNSEQAVHQTSDRVQQLLDSSWAALQQADARARQVARHANAAAYHIQFGDIVRQKLEHLAAALEDAQSAIHADTASETAKADLILAIQVGQIEAIILEIGSGQTELNAAFSGLAEETDQLVLNARQLDDTASSTGGSSEDLFARLKEALLRLDGWQNRGRELCAEAQNMTREAAEYSAKLAQFLDQVQTINREMHLQALNAIVKTALLGDQGTTLGVLSTHVHSISEESNGIVKATAALLARIREQAAGSLAIAAASPDHAPLELRQSLTQILGIPQKFQEIGQASITIAERQQSQIVAARTRLEFLGRLVLELQDVIDASNAIRQGFRPATSQAYLKADLTALDQRYTMASEREVHRRIVHTVTGTTPPPSEPLTRVATTPANEEFFDCPAPPVNETPAPVATLGAAMALAAPVASAGGDLGDNVELF